MSKQRQTLEAALQSVRRENREGGSMNDIRDIAARLRQIEEGLLVLRVGTLSGIANELDALPGIVGWLAPTADEITWEGKHSFIYKVYVGEHIPRGSRPVRIIGEEP